MGWRRGRPVVSGQAASLFQIQNKTCPSSARQRPKRYSPRVVPSVLPSLLHELANRVNTTGLAMQLLAESKDPPCPPELRERLLELRGQLAEAMGRLHAMQELVRRVDAVGQDARANASSSGSSAA